MSATSDHSGDSALRVLIATGRLVAIDKPAWMLSVPGKGPDKQDCAAARVRAMFPQARGPLVVHRLDMETSGILIFGLDPESQRELSRQFEQREVVKRYVALVRGDLDPRLGGAGVIDLPIRADLEHRPLQIVDHDRGDPSSTRWRLLGRERLHGEPVTRIEFEPLTGRTHQLRIHAAMAVEAGGLGAPIIGDMLYGPERERAEREEGWRPERLMLHASRLVITDPDSIPAKPARAPGHGAQQPGAPGDHSGRRIVIESPPPF